VPTVTHTVPLNGNQVTESLTGFDTWLTPWLSATNFPLMWGETVGITINLPPNQRIATTDGWFLNYKESFHLNVRGHFGGGDVPPNMDQMLELKWWFSGVSPANVDPRIPTSETTAWDSYNTPYRVHVKGNGQISYVHDLQLGNGAFSFKDIHLQLKNYHLKDGSTTLDYYIESFQVGVNRDNIYLQVPEPSEVGLASGLAALGFAWVHRRCRKDRSMKPKLAVPGLPSGLGAAR